ncbi:MAG: TRAP transporter small permease subunit [Synergistaceae bacterium]|jgi:TRAP-type C4-dicarboxylate transport system permease small subunit|nr:TRAP transporter small permease subunit [Synergistaceae bacterium]
MYSKFLDKTVWLFERCMAILFGASIAVVSLQIFFRYVIGSPLNWTEQVARCIFIWLFTLSIPLLMRKKGAVAFDLLIGFLSFKAREIMVILVQLLILFFAVYYFVFSVDLCRATTGRVMAGVRIPQNSVYIVTPVSMFVLILVTFEHIAGGIKALKGGKR